MSIHIDNIRLKCSNQLDMLRSLKYRIDRSALETIYMSFIRPVMEYGDVLYAGASNILLNKLDRLQYNAMLTVSGARSKTPSITLYSELGWESLTARRNKHCILMMYKLFYGKCPNYLQSLLNPLKLNDNPHHFRDDLKLRHILARSRVFSSSFVVRSIKLWNKVDYSTRQLPSYATFKRKINSEKSHCLSKDTKKLWNLGPRVLSIAVAQLRMNCSRLNNDLTTYLHVRDDALCRCGDGPEDANHYLLRCTLHTDVRCVMLAEINCEDVSVNDLLYGKDGNSLQENINILKAVFEFIRSTNRLL
jgi:hypothetical protein